MTNVLIRKAIQADIPRIVAFQQHMALETEALRLDPATLLAGVSAVFESGEKGFYLVAEKAGLVVASLMVTQEWSDWRNQTVWWIQSVYVEPGSRKQGIYARMYAFLQEEIAARPDIAGIRLYVDERNTAAQAVYRALGMNGDHYRVFEAMKS